MAIQRLRQAAAQLRAVGRDEQARQIEARADELLQQLRSQIEERCRAVERAIQSARPPRPAP